MQDSDGAARHLVASARPHTALRAADTAIAAVECKARRYLTPSLSVARSLQAQAHAGAEVPRTLLPQPQPQPRAEQQPLTPPEELPAGGGLGGNTEEAGTSPQQPLPGAEQQPLTPPEELPAGGGLGGGGLGGGDGEGDNAEDVDDVPGLIGFIDLPGLLLAGHLLARSCNAFAGQEAALLDVWVAHVMPRALRAVPRYLDGRREQLGNYSCVSEVLTYTAAGGF
ncbi:hypothetical protein T492DRAFT_859716 [Pavlovales sp. CCMP2436]|nr:hypothetical protein T492DRAFT_859716 [Pavlovales sp. CCMP2436]